MTVPRTDATFRNQLLAGIAIFNAGERHAAHDAWEDRWLELPAGTPDERFLHGMIQYTAAVHHAEAGNSAGARGLATSAQAYLAELGDHYRGVALVPIRHVLGALAADPAVVSDRGVPPILLERNPASLETVEWRVTAIAGRVLAAGGPAWDVAVIDRAIERAGRDDQYTALITDFVRSPAQRGLIYDRLARHLERERAQDRDVRGLFDPD